LTAEAGLIRNIRKSPPSGQYGEVQLDGKDDAGGEERKK